jgi:hypothetical protein
MPESIDLTRTFMEVVGDLRSRVDWDRRLNADAAFTFGRADGSFGDVVASSDDARLDGLSFSMLLFSYNVLLHDTATPKEIVLRLLPPLTAAFVKSLKATPIKEQDMSDLVRFMTSYSEARGSGRFAKEEVAEITKVVQQMADNFSAKCALLPKIKGEPAIEVLRPLKFR